MAHAIHRVSQFQLRGDYRLELQFEDGVRRLIDFEPVLQGALFGPLRDPELFRQVRLDPEAGTIVWPNDADFDPATLHEWPEVKDSLIDMARRWTAGGRGAPAAGQGSDQK